MPTVQMKTEHEYKHGQTNIIPYAGAITISKDGLIEVPSLEIAQKIEKADIGFTIFEGKQGKASAAKNLRKGQDTAPVETEKEDEEDLNEGEDLKEKSESSDIGKDNDDTNDELGGKVDNSELIKALDAPEMTLKILQDTAKNSNFPRTEWGNKNKADLVTYLKEKLSE